MEEQTSADAGTARERGADGAHVIPSRSSAIRRGSIRCYRGSISSLATALTE
jgi:hypothetical protein